MGRHNPQQRRGRGRERTEEVVVDGVVEEAGLRELQVEMIDRFGLLPQPIKNLFEVAGLQMLVAQRVA